MRPLHLATPFHEPESATRLDFEVDPARDFAPERAQNVNVYEAVVDHVAELRRAEHKVVLASYSAGARERLKGLLADHGLTKVAEADSWQEAQGAVGEGQVALAVFRSTTASPPPTSRCSPSRTCSATGSSAGASARRAPTPS